jgi:hypothetical protein
MSESVKVKKGPPTKQNLLTMSWPSASACRSYLRRNKLGTPSEMGLTIGMHEKEGVGLFVNNDAPLAKPEPERKAAAKKAAPAKKEAAKKKAAAPARAPGERAPRVSKYADLVKKAFKLACREEGATRQELNALNDGKPLDWKGRLTRHAKANGYKLTESHPDGRHPTYKARLTGGGGQS